MINSKTVIFVLTNRCNLNCVYCYENHSVSTGITFDDICEICKNELLALDGTESVIIDFFGGEPFLEFETIRNTVAFLKSNKWPKKWHCFATTNGTLVHGTIQEWLKDNRDVFSCGLSLDGTPEIHNKNRSNSFEQIDIPFFRKMYPNQAVKMTISNYTLGTLFEGITYVHGLGFPIACNFAYGVNWNVLHDGEKLSRELEKLVDFYLNNPQTKPCTLLNLGVEYISTTYNRPFVKKWCGVGTHMKVFIGDGHCYPCETFIPMSLQSEKEVPIGFEREIMVADLDDKCKECIYKGICPTCYGSNYKQFGSIYRKADDYCEMMKIVFRATTLLKYRKMMAGQIDCSDSEKLMLLESVELVNR